MLDFVLLLRMRCQGRIPGLGPGSRAGHRMAVQAGRERREDQAGREAGSPWRGARSQAVRLRECVGRPLSAARSQFRTPKSRRTECPFVPDYAFEMSV